MIYQYWRRPFIINSKQRLLNKTIPNVVIFYPHLYSSNQLVISFKMFFIVGRLTARNFGLNILRGFLVELYGRMRVYSKLLLFTQRFTGGDFPLTLVARRLQFAKAKVENWINNDIMYVSDCFDHNFSVNLYDKCIVSFTDIRSLSIAFRNLKIQIDYSIF